MAYTIDITLTMSYDEAVPAVKAAFQDQGFGTLTEIDVQATLKSKLDLDIEPYIILGACNPQLAHQALDIDRAIGALLPCNVVIRQKDDKILVQAMNPQIMTSVPGNAAIQPIADQASTRIEAALHALQQDTNGE